MAANVPTVSRTFTRRSEIVRLILLGAVAAWLLRPFATSRQIGAGDALWYANMLADFCLQWRAGVFPVFVGQTEFAFNGAVYPLRVAPYYQHLGGVLDLLTAHRLSWFTLQHLCVIFSGAAGIFSCYFSLTSLAPAQRWSAAALATLYLSCPGVLGTIYTQDLYMTWMTVPFVPLAVYGAVRAFQRDDLIAQTWLAAALAALWLAHAPIAMWMTFLAALIQIIRLLFVHRTMLSWRRALLGALLFGALANYPFVSVAALQIPNAGSTVTGGLDHEERISNVVREVFPAVLRPVSDHARALSDLQLGYGLWLVLLVAILSAALKRSWAMLAVALSCVLLLVLVLPVPGNEWLWSHLPATVKRITFYWPMQRFYLLLAGLLAVAGQLGFTAWTHRNVTAAPILLGIVCVGAGWSLWESRQFIAAAADRTATAEVTALRQRPENILLMNHAYGLFPALPDYFSNGVMDPRAETRLLDRETLEPIRSVVEAAGFQPLHGQVDENPGVLKLDPVLHLESQKRYELIFEFLPRTYTGILQLTGRGFFREYVLPASGQTLAFGALPAAAHKVSLWTTLPDGGDLVLRFIPTATGEKPADYIDFGRYLLKEITPSEEAVNVTALVPYRANVRLSRTAWVETPRMFQSGYLASVDQKEVRALPSPRGLTMLPVDSGQHAIDLQFHGPASLRVAYWFALTSWAALFLSAAFSGWRRLRN